jgi:hypothetical protein
LYRLRTFVLVASGGLEANSTNKLLEVVDELLIETTLINGLNLDSKLASSRCGI